MNARVEAAKTELELHQREMDPDAVEVHPELIRQRNALGGMLAAGGLTISASGLPAVERYNHLDVSSGIGQAAYCVSKARAAS